MTPGKWMLAAIVMATAVISDVATRDRVEAQEPPVARGPITPHSYPLDDGHYLRWALPPS